MTTTEETKLVEAKGHWLIDLLQRQFGKKEQGQEQKDRKPLGFTYNQNPFDPSSYYKQLGSFRDISKAATEMANIKNYNRLEAERIREQEALERALRGGLGNINPGFTYDNHDHSSYGSLGKVSANTAAAAKYFGSKYGITNIGGWRSKGSVPGSDHPKGLALDFMTGNKALGTKLAYDVIKNSKQWKVKYVIWYRYIWSPGRGWRPYSGPSDHTDHVHVSFFS